MKYIALALLLVGVAAAQTHSPHNPFREMVEALEKRARALLEMVHHIQHEHRGEFGHLMSAIDHEAVLVEALAIDLAKQLADHKEHSLHHIHVIEEDLLALENRVSEEIAILMHFIHEHHNHDHDHEHHDAKHLIERGQALVKEANEALKKYPDAREAKDMKAEIVVVEALIKAIEAKPKPTEEEMRKDAEQLARHEHTLRQLIERASHRHHDHHHHDDDN